MDDKDSDAMDDDAGDAMKDKDDDPTEHDDGDAMDDKDDDAMDGEESALSSDCLPGGVLDDAATIASCSIEASQQVEGFSFDATFNLLAVFPIEGVGEEAMPAMELRGRVSPPDRFEYMISLGPEGETIEISGVTIGADSYVRDPESGQWFKGVPPDSEFLSVVPMVGMLLSPNDVGATLSETVDLDDGSKAYVLVYDQPDEGTGMEGFGFPGGDLTTVVGADDFLTREVRVGVEGLDGEVRDVVTITYHGYEEMYEIEPPEQYFTLPDFPDDGFGPGSMEGPTVLGLATNEDGDVEVTFSEPVHVQGEVGLYVLDLETGGWELPFIGGSGTDTLTFDADAQGRPALVPGESQIAGITFPAADSEIADADGNWPILDFEPWTYGPVPGAGSYEPFVIGAMDALTGVAESYGNPLLQAKLLAVEEINAAGGIHGRELQLIVEDSKCAAQDAITAYNKLTDVDGVRIILGATCSGAMLGAAPLAERDGVVLLSASATSPDIAFAGDYIFRTAINDLLLGVDIGNTLWVDGVRSIATITESTDYAEGARRTAVDRFEELGGSVVAAERYSSNVIDFRSQLAKLLDEGPDAILLASQGEASGGTIVKQARELGYDGPIYSEIVPVSPEALAIAGDAATGMKAIIPNPELTSAAGREFLARFEARYDTVATLPWFQGSAYDGVYIAGECLRQTGDDQDADGFRDCLYGLTWSGAIGDGYSFDEYGDVVGLSNVVVQVLPPGERTEDNLGYRVLGPAPTP